MDRIIQFSYVETNNEKHRLGNISDILGKEIFTYLKNQGYLKKRNESNKVNEVLENTKKRLDKTDFLN